MYQHVLTWLIAVFATCALAGPSAYAQQSSGSGTFSTEDVNESLQMRALTGAGAAIEATRQQVETEYNTAKSDTDTIQSCLQGGKFMAGGGCASVPDCGNDGVLTFKDGAWSCVQAVVCRRITCTSKAGRSQTVTGKYYMTGGWFTAIAPTGGSVWVVRQGGPYYNCFNEPAFGPGLDFAGVQVCKDHNPNGPTGVGRFLQTCGPPQPC